MRKFASTQGIILEEEGGIMLVDIFQKVCEDLYASKQPFQVVWESSELLLDKMFADYSKIGDQDYLKLTSTLSLTKKTCWFCFGSPSKATKTISAKRHSRRVETLAFQRISNKQNKVVWDFAGGGSLRV